MFMLSIDGEVYPCSTVYKNAVMKQIQPFPRTADEHIKRTVRWDLKFRRVLRLHRQKLEDVSN